MRLVPTTPDDIPPVHVLEAAQEMDRREAEDLLAAFDRPGRSPRQPPRKRDFVDYYSNREARRRSRGDDRPQNEISTFVLPRKSRSRWVPWSFAIAAMFGLGTTVAFLGTCRSARTNELASSAAPSAATTITSGGGAPLDPGRLAPATTAEIRLVPESFVTPPPPLPGQAATQAPPTSLAPTSIAVEAPSVTRAARAARAANASTPTPSPSSNLEPAPAERPAGPRRPPPRDDFIRDL